MTATTTTQENPMIDETMTESVNMTKTVSQVDAHIDNLQTQVNHLLVRVTLLEQCAVDGDGEEIGSSRADLRCYESIIKSAEYRESRRSDGQPTLRWIKGLTWRIIDQLKKPGS